MKKVVRYSTIALGLACLSSVASADVENGALVDRSGEVVSSRYEKCVIVKSGAPLDPCLDVQPEEPKPEPKQERVKVEQSISLEADALFAIDSAVITDAGQASLDGVVNGLSRLESYNVSVVGHADSTGTDAYNQALSERRAQSVADYLVSRGVDGSTISASGRGESDPVASNKTREGRAQNRRVDVQVSGVEVVYK